jgi:hypothetical protein
MHVFVYLAKSRRHYVKSNFEFEWNREESREILKLILYLLYKYILQDYSLPTILLI